MKPQQPNPLPISAQAAQWLCELAEADEQTQAAFHAWLRQSPKHVEEFLFASTTWQLLRQVGARRPLDSAAILADAFGAQAISNVVALQAQPGAAIPQTTPQALPQALPQVRRRNALWPARIAAGLALVGLGLSVWWFTSTANTYATATGEQRAVRLSDGSVVHLNTQSRIEIQFSDRARDIRLLKGEALFIVHQERARPFRVTAGDGVIQAVGTQFNVYRYARVTGGSESGFGDIAVSVLEGAVSISTSATPAAGTTPPLRAGEQAVIHSSGRVVKHAAADVTRAIAWRERRLVFKAERLENVVAEINRYSTRRVRIEGEAARNTLLTATFAADSPESLAEFLKRYSTLTVESRSDGWVIRAHVLTK
jgi:transmembrane sensor